MNQFLNKHISISKELRDIIMVKISYSTKIKVLKQKS